MDFSIMEQYENMGAADAYELTKISRKYPSIEITHRLSGFLIFILPS